jgi:hypothetical protein
MDEDQTHGNGTDKTNFRFEVGGIDTDDAASKTSPSNNHGSL